VFSNPPHSSTSKCDTNIYLSFLSKSIF